MSNFSKQFLVSNLELRICPACKQSKFKKIKRLSKLNYVKCKICGLYYSLNIPSKEALDFHYNSYPRTGEVSVLNFDTYNSWVKLLFLNSESKLLDYGCGSGEWMNFCRARGINSSGVEQNQDIIKNLNARGLKVFEADYLLKKEVKFTAITSIEVLEHLTDVHLILKTFSQLLEQNGYLLITTPNYNSLNRVLWGSKWRAFSWPDHLQLFSSKSMKSLLEQNGFQVEKIETSGHILFDFWDSELGKTSIIAIEKQREFFQSNLITRLLKRLINSILRILRLGDTLTVVAKTNQTATR